jgi:FkbM family methyltransferase
MFGFGEACSIVAAMFGRKIATMANRYILISKTKFDFYQQRNIEIKKKGSLNIISFISKFSGKKLLFSIRRKTTDLIIFDEVLLNGAYYPAVTICKENGFIPALIIDAGANVGSSAVFFKDVFPDSQIICIEPEEDNFKMLKQNFELNKFENVHFVNGGLWHKNEALSINEEFRNGYEKELSFSLTHYNGDAAGVKSIQGYTIESILKQHNASKADILKIDIEGAEAFLFDSFEATLQILQKTRLLAIELHDESIDRFMFTRYVEDAGYKQVTFGEVTYVYKPLK